MYAMFARSTQWVAIRLLLSCELLQAEADHLQRVLRGPQADAVAVAGDVQLADLGVFAVGETDIDEADGLVCVGAGGCGRAGDAGDADAEGRAGALRMPSARARATFSLTAPSFSSRSAGTPANSVLAELE